MAERGQIGGGSVGGTQEAAVAARPAASLILVRRETDEIAVLMGMRGAAHRFMPNRLVFPGGAVEPGDTTAAAASEPSPETLSHLSRNADPSLARGLAMAATRELEEETGLSFGTPPQLGTLHYLCRAITPPTRPIRFDARFFIADAAGVTGALGGSGELDGVRWYRLAEVLQMDLALVTREVLRHFQAWLREPETWRGAEARTPVFISQRWSME